MNCKTCGNPLLKNNKTGQCQRTVNCRRVYHRLKSKLPIYKKRKKARAKIYFSTEEGREKKRRYEREWKRKARKDPAYREKEKNTSIKKKK